MRWAVLFFVACVCAGYDNGGGILGAVLCGALALMFLASVYATR